MEIKLLNNTGSITVSESAFNVDYNEALVHQVVVAYQAGGRSGSRKQKTRGEVHGSNKKPWNQKKTGNARAGDRKGPLWRSGGVTFAARPQDHSQKVNKKMYRGALRSIFSELVRQDRLVVAEDFTLETLKTKELVGKLKELNLTGKVLYIDNDYNVNLDYAGSNLFNFGYFLLEDINPVGLLYADKVVVSSEAVKQLEEMLK